MLSSSKAKDAPKAQGSILSLALRSRGECKSMCSAPKVGGDGVATRRFVMSDGPCRLARRSAASRAGTGWLTACCSPGFDKCTRGDRAEIPCSSCSCRDHNYGDSGIDQHAATGVFTARPSLQDLVERLGQVMAAGQFGELFAHIDLSRCRHALSRKPGHRRARCLEHGRSAQQRLRRAKVI